MTTRKSSTKFVIAALLGLLAAATAYYWMQGRMTAIEADKTQGTPVVVAASEIAFGEKIAAASLKTINWPSDSVPEGVFHRVDEAVGGMANQKIMKGELVLQQRVLTQVSGNSLSTLIEPSKRAVSVRVNDVIGVGGFLLPGNRVDVLATRVDNERHARTRTLLQNIKVLAVDQTAQAEKDKPVVVRAVTLEMDPQQVELLVQATEEGTVQLALRNPDDAAVSADEVQAQKTAPGSNDSNGDRPSGGSTITVIRETRADVSNVKP